MNIYILPIFAVIIGFLFVFIIKDKKSEVIKLLLPFSGAFLLALTLFELLPETFEISNKKSIGLLIISGILTQIILEYFSEGAEHGHIHTSSHNNNFPWLLFISLCFHSFLEGFPIHEGNSLVYGIFVHKIPITLIISAFLIQHNFSKSKIFLFLFVFGIMTPMGSFISNNFPVIQDYIHFINAFVVGVYLHVSTTIILESNEGHKINLTKFATIILGIGLAYIM